MKLGRTGSGVPTQLGLLLQAIPTVPDVQSAWLLLLHCASPRANFYLRAVRPELALQFARGHDARENLCDETTRSAETLPLALGGSGMRSAERSRVRLIG